MKTNTITIVAHLPHSISGGKIYAYEAYVREIEIWSEIFTKVIIYTEVVDFRPDFPVKILPDNCSVVKVPMKSGPSILSKIQRILQLPIVVIQMFFVLLNADLLHLRSPGITTLLVNLINRIFNKPVIVKWATQFAPMPIPNIILHLELKLLQKPRSNTKVLIYGISENPNHISFIPALMSISELPVISDSILNKPFSDPVNILCVGRLFRFKEFDQVIIALASFNEQKKHVNWTLSIVGDGEESLKLKELVHKKGLDSKVKFLGKMSFKATCEIYSNSDISIIPGRYEGWCKVINESWSFGVIPMVTSGGNTAYPVELSDGAGIIYDQDLSDFAEKLESLINLSNSEKRDLRLKGFNSNFDMTLENFKLRLENLIYDWKY
jgi:glycosyltransferase involved in cell wall biosynthesis